MDKIPTCVLLSLACLYGLPISTGNGRKPLIIKRCGRLEVPPSSRGRGLGLPSCEWRKPLGGHVQGWANACWFGLSHLCESHQQKFCKQRCHQKRQKLYRVLCWKNNCFAKHQPGMAGLGWLWLGRTFLATWHQLFCSTLHKRYL